MQDGWAKNLARDSTSISHAEIRCLHLPAIGALRTQRWTAGDHGWRPAGYGALRTALDAGARFPASSARVEVDSHCRRIRPADALGRLPRNDPKALSGADL